MGKLVKQLIPNLIGGISQQPSALRRPDQCSEMVNGFCSVVEGLKKRPPTIHRAQISATPFGDAFIHTINRDATERYVVVIANGDLKVFNLAGVEQTVNFPDGKAYLAGATPSQTFQALTVADHTFILNKDMVVTMANNLSPAYPSTALFFVRAGQYGSQYQAVINGAVAASVTTSSTDVNLIRTETIAGSLHTNVVSYLNTIAPGQWATGLNSHVFFVRRLDNSPFTVDSRDSQAGRSFFGFGNSVQRLSDLPTVAPNGYQVEIKGEPNARQDNYWVRFQVEAAGGTFGTGYWQETLAPGIPFQLNANTMPHLLVREPNGTFTFRRAAWGNRVAGNEETSPAPSFVGRTIEGLFIYKNRLAFISDENVIMSRSGSFYDFFRETVTANLDSDPIDVAVSSAAVNQVALLHHALPSVDGVVLFSGYTQFVLKGDALLTQETVRVDVATEYPCLSTVAPVAAGSSLFFASPAGGFTALREFLVQADTELREAVDITSHVPKFIPKNVSKLAASTHEQTLAVLSDDTPDTLYVYKYFWGDREKLLSSWGKWQLPGATILNVDFIESTLWVVVQRGSRVFLESMDISPKAIDPGAVYLTHLDRRVQETQTTRVYNATSDTTAITLPYPPSPSVQVVGRTGQVNTTPGNIYQVVSVVGSVVTVRGNLSTHWFYVGEPYTLLYRFSPFFLKQQEGGASRTIEGRLQIRRLRLRFEETGFFEIHVTPKYRPTSVHMFSGDALGSGSNVLNAVSLHSAAREFAVLAKNDEVTIELQNDSPLPCALQGGEWAGLFYTPETVV